MKILIADKLAPEGAAFLKSQPGVEVTSQTGLTGEELAQALRQHDGVVVRSAVKITADVLDACMNQRSAATTGKPSRLRGIVRAGVGVDNIDLNAATRYGVAVMNSASATTITTAEHAFALMIGLARNIGHAHMTMAGGGWDRNKFTGTQLQGKTLGVVGFGRIGQAMAQRVLAFGMKVMGYDPYYNADTALDGSVKMVKSFDEMVPEVDIISFHVPKTESTTGMLGAAQFAKARPGLLVVNASRGGIVDEEALLKALDNGQCAGAALDVFTSEPLPEDSPLRNHPKILTTPHLGASTVEAQEAVAVDACKALLSFLRGEGVDSAVNIGKLNLDLSERQQAFVDLGSRMVALLQAAVPDVQLGSARFTLRGESLAGRADTIARFALADLLKSHLDQPVNVINAALIAEQRKIETETIITSDTGEDRMTIELAERSGGDGRTWRVEGAVYADGMPRVTHLGGYSMDMVPEGDMVLLTNADEPGRIGVVGDIFGSAGINIAEMVIGRKPVERGDAAPRAARSVAMMIIKVDQSPSDALLKSLREAPGIIRVATVKLPGVGDSRG
jgi:D-3-phosphoglycerate dehydrogenase / 2-oxoglutarate reductase